ncbi:hypothetical protein PSN45_001314 [Yamadazyma tenuis]|uniref:Prefoldin n=1 Tax=Candida tenuis (strain ATCC 10573 / BCRC 21748 / CBS 615 / JCM 9827 / NBRC 10315 / NRRL Y-1498 / VKM Y-70) TaxID=590646 RepID=G3BD14_CANTC|nr:uncharacterized protein CANTEDRAFT_100195 [Yamadazyma tenuis ATCC 10573]EGV60948.1 hypothetical protein CANTEDRAFT_100195 [Yamadazyma tenuis ATCC 10573]WEJ93837.1 hypothetical protein PSN45_001314 [Yamadazyma tenuis]
MSMNPEALQKLLLEMDNQLNKSRAELSMCDLQLSRVETNLNMIKQTTKSLNAVCDTASDEKVWKGVGKAFVATDVNTYLKGVSNDEKEFLDSKKSLQTKQRYLETTLKNTIDHMTKLVSGKSG